MSRYPSGISMRSTTVLNPQMGLTPIAPFESRALTCQK